jgi:hypothetical protein
MRKSRAEQDWVRFHFFSDDTKDFWVGDADGSQLSRLTLVGLENPFHAVAMILDVLPGQLAEL